MSQVNMTVTLFSAVGLSLRVNPTIIQFYPTKLTASILLYISDATLWTVGKTTKLIITPTSTNTYAGGATITLTGVQAPSESVSVSLASKSINVKNVSFNISCSEHGKFIYHISREFKYNLTACSMNKTQILTWS